MNDVTRITKDNYVDYAELIPKLMDGEESKCIIQHNWSVITGNGLPGDYGQRSSVALNDEDYKVYSNIRLKLDNFMIETRDNAKTKYWAECIADICEQPLHNSFLKFLSEMTPGLITERLVTDMVSKSNCGCKGCLSQFISEDYKGMIKTINMRLLEKDSITKIGERVFSGIDNLFVNINTQNIYNRLSTYTDLLHVYYSLLLELEQSNHPLDPIDFKDKWIDMIDRSVTLLVRDDLQENLETRLGILLNLDSRDFNRYSLDTSLGKFKPEDSSLKTFRANLIISHMMFLYPVYMHSKYVNELEPIKRIIPRAKNLISHICDIAKEIDPSMHEELSIFEDRLLEFLDK